MAQVISICGRLFPVGTRVLLWSDSGGYDAYREHCHLDPEVVAPRDAPDCAARYGRRRGSVGKSLESLREGVDRIVLHYDAAGSSRRCFEILHDIRGLSCHFLLDLDGTIYQTLDLRERAWHAGPENDRSVGVEIANPGAYPDRSVLPPGAGGPDEEPVYGEIRGVGLWQYEFTTAQYRALGRLAAALCGVLEIPARIPAGHSANSGFQGILGHYHVSTAKVDPGPAFRWDRLLRDVHRHGVP